MCVLSFIVCLGQRFDQENVQVGALIDELAKGEAGSFDLVRQRSLQRVIQRRQESKAGARGQEEWASLAPSSRAPF